jgi:hypothetical protein
MQEYDGRNGNGYQPYPLKGNKPWVKSNFSVEPAITWKTLLWFGFCCGCIGMGIGSIISA